MQKRYSRAQKDQALALARDHGLAEASRRMGIPRNTIKAWQRRGAGSDELTIPEPPRRRGAESEGLERIQQSLASTLDEYDRLIQIGEHAAARHLASPIGVFTEKVLLLRRDGESSAATSAAAAVAGTDREQQVARILELQDQARQMRRDRLRVTLSSVHDPVVSDWWLSFVGCVRGDPDRGEGWRPPAPVSDLSSSLETDLADPYTTVFNDNGLAGRPVPMPRPKPPVKPEPVPVVVRDVVPSDDDVVVDEPVASSPVRRPRALPRGSVFPRGRRQSVQELLGGYWGPEGDRRG